MLLFCAKTVAKVSHNFELASLKKKRKKKKKKRKKRRRRKNWPLWFGTRVLLVMKHSKMKGIVLFPVSSATRNPQLARSMTEF